MLTSFKNTTEEKAVKKSTQIFVCLLPLAVKVSYKILLLNDPCVLCKASSKTFPSIPHLAKVLYLKSK